MPTFYLSIYKFQNLDGKEDVKIPKSSSGTTWLVSTNLMCEVIQKFLLYALKISESEWQLRPSDGDFKLHQIFPFYSIQIKHQLGYYN